VNNDFLIVQVVQHHVGTCVIPNDCSLHNGSPNLVDAILYCIRNLGDGISGQERRRKSWTDANFRFVQDLRDAIVEGNRVLDAVGLRFKLFHKQPEEAVRQVVNGITIDMVDKGGWKRGIEVIPVVATIFAVKDKMNRSVSAKSRE